ncbi:26118_t:CDS:2, partial [Gigaspora rosea]
LFDLFQKLILYGKKVQESMIREEFWPTFAKFIKDFDTKTKCLGCHSFPRCGSAGLCCVCKFYLENGLLDQIPDKNYLTKLENNLSFNLDQALNSILYNIFGFKTFRIGQKEAIEIIQIGIPCASLYASSDQPRHFQECVFTEIAAASFLFTTAICTKSNKETITKRLKIDTSSLIICCASESWRDNLSYEVRRKQETRDISLNEIIVLIRENEPERSIIYCASHEHYDELVIWLYQHFDYNQVGIATNVFGMGVNSKDVRLVIHWTFPLKISNMIKEVGRAGRDNLPAKSVVFYSCNDVKT